ncbi:hypothetical protein, partial [Devosia geojensis]|uniref:hypothetical protein n=1 Tax=Devosia geojensis TaxID=443610 RepID=UPI001364BAC6
GRRGRRGEIERGGGSDREEEKDVAEVSDENELVRGENNTSRVDQERERRAKQMTNAKESKKKERSREEIRRGGEQEGRRG